ncbi:GNAT family N-acetyltransferase [Cohnella suwonensis]|uniref:GNAT family N-acetyltransferase n=1 Tax=Cohnella suwonensis TaxID=696072 RepID=A0ABW0M323_9BACL
MAEGIIIKEYSDEFQSQVVELILNIQQNEYNIPITKHDQPDLFNIVSFYQNGTGNFWVALHNDRVIGTIALVDIGNNQVALRKMFVEESYRGKIFSTASQLLCTVLEWAKVKSIKEVILGTTLQFVAAHRFYEKNGFVSVSVDELPANFPVMAVDKKFYKFTVQC